MCRAHRGTSAQAGSRRSLRPRTMSPWPQCLQGCPRPAPCPLPAPVSLPPSTAHPVCSHQPHTRLLANHAPACAGNSGSEAPAAQPAARGSASADRAARQPIPMFSRRESGAKPRTDPPGRAEAEAPGASEKAAAATPQANGDAPGLGRLDSAQGKKSVFDRLGQGASGSVVRARVCVWAPELQQGLRAHRMRCAWCQSGMLCVCWAGLRGPAAISPVAARDPDISCPKAAPGHAAGA